MTNLELLAKIKEETLERTKLIEIFEESPETFREEVLKLNETEADWYKYELSYIMNLIKNVDIDQIKEDIINDYESKREPVVIETPEEDRERTIKHIILYSDEFRPFVWDQYSKILEFPKTKQSLKVYVDRIE